MFWWSHALVWGSKHYRYCNTKTKHFLCVNFSCWIFMSNEGELSYETQSQVCRCCRNYSAMQVRFSMWFWVVMNLFICMSMACNFILWVGPSSPPICTFFLDIVYPFFLLQLNPLQMKLVLYLFPIKISLSSISIIGSNWIFLGCSNWWPATFKVI